MSVTNPIINARLAYVNGLQLSWLSTTTFSMAAGAASNSTDINDIELLAPVTNTITVVGPNGVDIAAAVASTFYAVYVIGDSNGYQPTASLLSLATNSAPSLPFGYNMYRRVGYVLTDSGSHVLKFWQYGNGSLKDMWYDTPIATPAITTSASYVTQSLAAGVPAITCEAFLKYDYGAATAGNNFQIGPYGSTPTAAMIEVTAAVIAGTAHAIGPLVVPTALNAGVPTVEHKETSTSDSLALYVSGYRDSL